MNKLDTRHRPIDPSIIIAKCDEALMEVLEFMQGDGLDRGETYDWTDANMVDRKIRATRDMIKRHGYGND